ncbi:unnamed protein product [Bursaphelenchus okinawaensis]|uniref:Uncharacterized protein n=1 Tax=Bursaphelenchus okinawaensis TaxID=465554 RepID=A0A811JV13_9BILA|nr:unnamed protein product [Bursaphelenchus okinawaensis]CAG9085221.1 unnamed protein product [Bursaphelenchus okinawaensis]
MLLKQWMQVNIFEAYELLHASFSSDDVTLSGNFGSTKQRFRKSVYNYPASFGVYDALAEKIIIRSHEKKLKTVEDWFNGWSLFDKSYYESIAEVCGSWLMSWSMFEAQIEDSSPRVGKSDHSVVSKSINRKNTKWFQKVVISKLANVVSANQNQSPLE